MNEYKLTLTVTITAQDDPAARQQAKDVVEAVNKAVPGVDAKLRQIYTDKPPRGVRLS